MTSWRSSSSRFCRCAVRTAVCIRAAMRSPSVAGLLFSPACGAGESLTLKLRRNDSRVRPALQVYLQMCRDLRIFAPAKTLQRGPRLVVHAIAHAGCRRLAVPRLLELGEEPRRRTLLHGTAGRAAQRRVGRDEADLFGRPVLGGDPFQQRVGVTRVADFEPAERAIVPTPVEDDDAPRSLDCDEVCEAVDELARAAETAGVEDVVAVEEVERGIRHGPRPCVARP